LSNIFIVIPCYNEIRLIRATVLSLLSLQYEIVIVDDGSSENIKDEISDLRIHYIRHFVNLGQGASLQTGTDYALQNGANYVAHFDADGQHRREDLEKMIDLIKEGNIDVVLGSRFLTSESFDQIPKVRKYILQVARIINVCFSGLWLTDAHNGLRVLNKRTATSIRLKENRMAHATEILQQIKTKKLNWREVSVKINYTKYSQEKGQSNWNALNILFDLIIRKFI